MIPTTKKELMGLDFVYSKKKKLAQLCQKDLDKFRTVGFWAMLRYLGERGISVEIVINDDTRKDVSITTDDFLSQKYLVFFNPSAKEINIFFRARAGFKRWIVKCFSPADWQLLSEGDKEALTRIKKEALSLVFRPF